METKEGVLSLSNGGNAILGMYARFPADKGTGVPIGELLKRGASWFSEKQVAAIAKTVLKDSVPLKNDPFGDFRDDTILIPYLNGSKEDLRCFRMYYEPNKGKWTQGESANGKPTSSVIIFESISN